MQWLLAIGCLFLASIVVDAVGRRFAIPRVTLLIGLGIAVSAQGLNLLPADARDWFHSITVIALTMLGFLLGEKFTLTNVRQHGRQVLWISIGASLGTSVVVTGCLSLLGLPLSLCLLLGGIAAATDPAATMDVIDEFGMKSVFAEDLRGIVALDDAWGLLVFSLCASLALIAEGNGGTALLLQSVVWEIGGAAILGLLIGVPAALLSGRLDAGQPTRVEALGVVFFCGGLSLWFGVSFLIAAMVLGATVANLARHHARPFHEIEGIEGPFLILFFILAGASLEMPALQHVGLLAAAYVASRIAGKWIGGWTGGALGGSDRATKRWVGLALIPQAGVAIGMALVAIERFPEYQELLLPAVIGSTVFFELVGPVFTRLAIKNVV